MSLKHIEWLKIRIQTAHLIFFGVAVLLIAGTIPAVYLGSRYVNEKQVQNIRKLIAQAESLNLQAEKNMIAQEELSSAEILISKAKKFLEMKDYSRAENFAEDAIQHLKFLLASYKSENLGIKGRFARIESMHGEVEMLDIGSADWVQIGLNQILRSGVKVRTRKSSTAELKFDDGSIIQMKADSLIMIRELTEDERTRAKRSNVELGKSEIEATFPKPRIAGSKFFLTLPDKSQAQIDTQSSVSIAVNGKKRSVVKVFMGQIDILAGERKLSLKNRQAIILDASKKLKFKPLSIPMPPQLIFPANVQLLTISKDQDSVLFRWTTIANVKKYKLQIGMDYNFNEIVKEEVYRENRVNISGLQAGNYFWRVFSITEKDLSSEPSPFNSFRLITADDLKSQQRDLTPPLLQIQKLNRMGHIVDISGRTEPDVRLYFNEKQEEVHENGTFRVLMEFKKSGLHEIFIEAYDSSGNVSTLRKEVDIPEQPDELK